MCRLRCVLAADNPLPTASPLAKTTTMAAIVSPEKQMDALVKKVIILHCSQFSYDTVVPRVRHVSFLAISYRAICYIGYNAML